MSSRSFHRWKSFWLGLLVLVFLGYGWFRSSRAHESIVVQTASQGWGAGNYSGEVYLFMDHLSRTPGFNWSRLPVASPTPSWPPVRFAKKWQLRISVTHWFLILAFFVPWISLLCWRVRQAKQIAGSFPISGS